MLFKCLKGTLNGNKFICEDGTQVNFIPYKGRMYQEGNVFALFRVNAGTYLLDNTVSC